MEWDPSDDSESLCHDLWWLNPSHWHDASRSDITINELNTHFCSMLIPLYPMISTTLVVNNWESQVQARIRLAVTAVAGEFMSLQVPTTSRAVAPNLLVSYSSILIVLTSN